jgi:uncharacterized membrane protein YbhN (UPF0104 family)
MHIVIVAVIVACCVTASLVIVNLWSRREDSVALSELDMLWASASVACMAGAVLTYAVCWWLLMRALDRGRIEFAPALMLFLVCWPGRYVPGSLPHYGGRLLAGPRAGMSRTAVAASLAYENLFAIASSGLLALLLLLVGFRADVVGSSWAMAAAVLALLSLGALHPAVVRSVIAVAARRVRRLRALDDHVLPAGAVVAIGAAYMVAALFAGLSLYTGVRAVAPGADPPILLVVASYNLAGIAGVLAIFVPSGIGVREGVVVALIGAAVSAPVALAAAVLVRLIAVAVDFAPIAIIAVWHAAGRLWRWHRPAVRDDVRQAQTP